MCSVPHIYPEVLVPFRNICVYVSITHSGYLYVCLHFSFYTDALVFSI